MDWYPTITLYVYGGRDASFTLYEDEGINYNYERGLYANIEFTYSEKEKILVLGKRDGGFAGMLIKRFFRIIYVDRNKPVGLDPDRKGGVLVSYEGNKLTIPLNK